MNIEAHRSHRSTQMFNSSEVLVVREHDQLSQTFDQKLTKHKPIQTKSFFYLLANVKKIRNRFIFWLWRFPGLGILCALSSGFFFASGAVLVKLLTQINSTEIFLVRCTGQLVVCIPIAIYTKNSVFGVKGEQSYLLLRAVLSAISGNCIYLSYRFLPLGDASTIVLSAPIFATVFAKIFLKEACDIINTILILLTLGGVLLIAKPTFLTGTTISSSHIVGSLIAFTACILDSLWFVANRKLQKTHFSVIIIVYSTVVIILDTVILSYLDGFSLPVCGNDGIYLVGVACCGIGGQLLLTTALKLENVGPVSIARTIDIVLAFIFQVTITGEKVTWSSVLGAILVSACAVLTAVRRYKAHKM
ncbi:solute carrier family 35 member G1-like [Tachypleus tridentatus]|uniref:solute carrier family 35 member G1-like n=1 Tax=Tachypleus tridentatus TaxID=6853 RepID=UPI003FD0D3B0